MTDKPNQRKIDSELMSRMLNTAWQKGLGWRSEKVQAVAECRHQGFTEDEIFTLLKRTGMIDATVKAIMKDAYYCDSSTEEILNNSESSNNSESATDYMKRRNKEKETQKPKNEDKQIIGDRMYMKKHPEKHDESNIVIPKIRLHHSEKLNPDEKVGKYLD
jgi:hypothetical protein